MFNGPREIPYVGAEPKSPEMKMGGSRVVPLLMSTAAQPTGTHKLRQETSNMCTVQPWFVC